VGHIKSSLCARAGNRSGHLSVGCARDGVRR
jgi:hypothetical protein